MHTILGEEKLISVFGYWPSFHDAEVWELRYERVPSGFSLVAVIHVFEMTDEVTTQGYFKLVKHTRVALRFNVCSEVSFSRFNHQNVLYSLDISKEDGLDAKYPFIVSFDSSYGLEGRLKCQSIEVIEAIPWIPPHGVYAHYAHE
ncbi:MAG: immunity 50 family protein [Puniceicoccales bacterium]|nr:immunity 50 family protein [Puniceicoccales bacterium]